MSPRSRAAHGIEYYTWRDLRLGRTINMYGRSLLLYDCDDATRAWVREHAPEVPEEELQTVPVGTGSTPTHLTHPIMISCLTAFTCTQGPKRTQQPWG